jgi:hypothetical protein
MGPFAEGYEGLMKMWVKGTDLLLFQGGVSVAVLA